MTTRTCELPQCGTPLPADAHPLKRYCGPQCSRQHRSPSLPADPDAQCAADDCTNQLPPRPPGQKGPAKLYCSTTCNQRQWYRNNAPAPAPAPPQIKKNRHCTPCDREFSTPSALRDHTARFHDPDNPYSRPNPRDPDEPTDDWPKLLAFDPPAHDSVLETANGFFNYYRDQKIVGKSRNMNFFAPMRQNLPLPYSEDQAPRR